MSKHSGLIGGSTAARILQCPGSWQAIMALPPSAGRPSEYAEEGTFAHEVMAYLMQGAAGPSIELANSLIGVKFHDRELTQEHLDTMILPALAALEDLQAEYGDGFKIVGIEKQVSFPGVLGAFGTVDLILRSPTHVIVVDYKFGQGVPVKALYQDPAGDLVNSQILFYLTAAMHSQPALFKGKPKLVGAIVQPRIEDGLSHTAISPDEIKWFTQDIHEAVMTAQDRNPPLKKGEECRWCPAKITCPLWTAPMLDLAAFGSPAPRTKQVGAAGDDYGEYLAYAKNLVDMLTLFKRDIDEQLHAYLEDGGKVPGWRLKAKTKKRQWIDDKTVEEVLLGLGFGMSEIWRSELQTFTATDATAKRLGVVVPGSLRQTPPTDETTVCRVEDPAPEVTKPLAIEQFRAALQSLVKS